MVAAWMGYADLAQKFLPASLRDTWPLVMIGGFACALWAVGRADEKIDGVLYRENIAHRKKIETLEKQLAEVQPRDISLETRAKIADRIDAGYPPLWDRRNAHYWKVVLYPLSSGPDSTHLARAIESVLEQRFDVEIGEEPAYYTAFLGEHWEGITLLEPQKFPGEPYEHREKCARLIADAFTAEGVVIVPGESQYRISEITIVIGSRS